MKTLIIGTLICVTVHLNAGRLSAQGGQGYFGVIVGISTLSADGRSVTTPDRSAVSLYNPMNGLALDILGCDDGISHLDGTGSGQLDPVHAVCRDLIIPFRGGDAIPVHLEWRPIRSHQLDAARGGGSSPVDQDHLSPVPPTHGQMGKHDGVGSHCSIQIHDRQCGVERFPPRVAALPQHDRSQPGGTFERDAPPKVPRLGTEQLIDEAGAVLAGAQHEDLLADLVARAVAQCQYRRNGGRAGVERCR